METNSRDEAVPPAYGVDTNSSNSRNVQQKASNSPDKELPQSQAPVTPEKQPGSVVSPSERSAGASVSTPDPSGSSSEPEFVVKNISVTTQSWGRRPAPPPQAVDPRRSAPKPELSKAEDVSSSEHAITAEAYPWIAMASTLEACFDSANQSETEKEVKQPESAPAGDHEGIFQSPKADTQLPVDPSKEQNTDEFSKAAPEIMKAFHAHGDACNKAETDSLKLATREQPNAEVEQPLQDYYNMLTHLENLQNEATSLEASITKLTSEFKETEHGEAETSARSQVLDVISACLPVLRARVSNLSMAQELVDSAQENVSLGLRMEQLGL